MTDAGAWYLWLSRQALLVLHGSLHEYVCLTCVYTSKARVKPESSPCTMSKIISKLVFRIWRLSVSESWDLGFRCPFISNPGLQQVWNAGPVLEFVCFLQDMNHTLWRVPEKHNLCGHSAESLNCTNQDELHHLTCQPWPHLPYYSLRGNKIFGIDIFPFS